MEVAIDASVVATEHEEEDEGDDEDIFEDITLEPTRQSFLFVVTIAVGVWYL